MALRRNRGFTLLEVLIAVLVFSLGMLGLAGMLVVSVKTNHSAYLRTQASFLAQSMADRMRANPKAVWTNSYNATYPAAGSDPCIGGAPCSSNNIAIRDRFYWGQQLGNFLPNPVAIIACVPAAGVATPNPAANPPYNGLCNMRITWGESSLVKGQQATPQTFVGDFQP
mgnify:CR=1 FL=1